MSSWDFKGGLTKNETIFETYFFWVVMYNLSFNMKLTEKTENMSSWDFNGG